MDLSPVKQLLDDPKKIIITTHTNPDGDAMGSSLGLYHYLVAGKHDVTVITPTPYPAFLHWMPGNDKVLIYNRNEESRKKAEDLIVQADAVFSLDYNNPERIEGLGEALLQSRAFKALIDHHPDPLHFADYELSDTSASSTSELIYRFITELGDENKVDKDIADCLYAGIMTDTGSFRFSSTSALTHAIVAKLIEAGAEHTVIHEHIFDNFSEGRTRLFGYALYEKLKVLGEYNTAYFALSRKELVSFNYKNGDTEGLVNYALGVEGAVFAALFMEKDGLVKISFRSTGSFPANAFARDHFGGGGHLNAAGGISELSLEDTVKKFEELLPQYQGKLNG